MRQRAFSRPVPIKTHISVKAELHEDDDTVLPLPLTPLTPRTEFDLRRACKALITSPAPSQPEAPYQHIPSNAAESFNQTTAQSIKSPISPDDDAKKAALLALTSKPHPAPPPLEPLSPVRYEFATTATARKFSVINLRASDATLKTTTLKSASITPSGATASPVLCRRPTVVDVSNRPKTADIRSRRQEKNPGLHGDREKLALFPRPSTSHQRPSTSHHRPSTSCNSKSAIGLSERPLPPLPDLIKPVQRSKSDSEVVLKKGSLGSLGRKIAGFFGRGKKQEAAAAA